MLREHWSLLGMPERECDCLGAEFEHSRKRREDFIRRFIDANESKSESTQSRSTQTEARRSESVG
jgi:hypothetical protein